MTFSSNSTQFSVDANLNVSGPASFTNAAVFANTITIQSQLIANGTNGTVGLLLLSGGSGNVYWGAANSVTSSFTNWQVNGAQTITASGSDTLNIIPGNNIVITASNSSIKSLTINANINLANTTTIGIVQLIDSVTNTSITLAATANTVKNAYDRAIDANTRASSAQTAAASAYSNAILVSATAYSNAVSDAAIDATTKAGTAYSNAIATAAADATTKAGTAYSNAIATAASDATTKAGTAYSNAIATASADATTKAGTAYSNAIATASADATTKAGTAYSNAIAYDASNTYVNDTFAAKASPTFTGTAQFSNTIITNSGTTHNVLGSGSGSRTIDLTLGNFVSATVTGTTTWTFSNPFTSPTAVVFILELTNGGSAALTWPAAVKWPNGTAPALTASGVDLLTFVTDDGGTTWRGVLSIRNSY
jgi:hypothetical protein